VVLWYCGTVVLWCCGTVLKDDDVIDPGAISHDTVVAVVPANLKNQAPVLSLEHLQQRSHGSLVRIR